jgi:succinate dehydrogenase flavin-adding protein (antitoxin of CptAB toxin-antitoxin module)
MNEANATPHAELIAELMNPNKPKNERENAAVREIERLRETRQAIIAGALFDFMGWLTSRKERIVLSFSDEASPAVNAIRDFAKMRGLSLDDAKVQDWHTTPPQRTWVGLTDKEIWEWFRDNTALTNESGIRIVRAIEAKLKEKNFRSELLSHG